MLDVPRLSTVLRQRVGGGDAHATPLDVLVAQRAETLRARTSSSSQASSVGGLDWHTFACAFSGSGEKHVRAVKSTFLELLAKIAELVGHDGDAGSAAAAARAVYRHFVLKTPGVDGVKLSDAKPIAALSADLHVPVDPKLYTKLGAMVAELHSWRRQHKLATEADDPLTETGSGVSSGTKPGGPSGFIFHPIHSALGLQSFASALSYPFSALAGTKLAALGEEEEEEDEEDEEDEEWEDPADARASGTTARAGSGPTGGRGDAVWLFTQCTHFAVTSGSVLSPLNMGTSILETLRKHGQDEGMLQSALFDLLGDSGFELMGALFEHRAVLANVPVADFKRIAAAMATAAGTGVDVEALETGRGTARQRPVMGTGVSVRSAADVRADKARQKVERKISRAAKTLADAGEEGTDALEALGFTPEYLALERSLGLQGGEVPQYGRVGGGVGGGGSRSGRDTTSNREQTLDDIINSIGAGYGGVKKKALPEGTVEEVHEGWREVIIPPAKPNGGVKFDPSRLVAVAQMETWAQEAFKGVKHLNRLQSELYESAYRSNENLLVCAPTGAGKTNVAMLAVCHELAQHVVLAGEGWQGRKPWNFPNKEFKIVYVAPMKALAQEIVAKFSERLGGLGMAVRELTGDMQLTKREIAETQVLVTTPEKWDVITRKSGDGSLVSLVRLLIIDEVHLLADGRGAVIESLVARTLRQVETSQSIIRIVGLSATLPNYEDVAMFLRVNPQKGLWYFNESYRPVPLQQRFIGVSDVNAQKRLNMMNEIAFQKAMAAVQRGKQVMVFVHSRKDTAKTARALRDLAQGDGSIRLLNPHSGVEAEDSDAYDARKGVPQPSTADGGEGGDGGGSGPAPASSGRIQGESRLQLNAAAWLNMQRDIEKSRNAELRELFPAGFGTHHAGMLRSDRLLTERMFAAGAIKILVCTATLAWGVNLPAHTVIIKGTQVYDAGLGGYNDLGMLDVMQIFGRAGRPQFDTSGEGIIITSGESLPKYLALLTSSIPIESNFIKALPDHLNAEIVSGTVTNVREAIIWLSYTYLYVRMMRNPLAYGVTIADKEADPMLDAKRLKLITQAAERLDEVRMIRYYRESGNLAVTDVGRVASHYYVGTESVFIFNEVMAKASGPNGHGFRTDTEVLDLICRASEFRQVKVRDEELMELDFLRVNACPVKINGDAGTTENKTNVLLQAYITGAPLRGFTLISDTAYIAQSAGRISRALFEMILRKGSGWCSLAERLLTISKAIDKRVWWMVSPLRQFNSVWGLQPDVMKKLEDCGQSLNHIADMDADELGALVRHPKLGPKLAAHIRQIPYLHADTEVQPITRSILRVRVKIFPQFEWQDRLHGFAEPFWLWIEDSANEHIYHSEYLLVNKRQVTGEEARQAARRKAAGKPDRQDEEVPVQGEDGGIELIFTIPIFEPAPPQYWLRCISDRWLGSESTFEIPFRQLVLPDKYLPHTDLLDLQPLPRACLHNPGFESFYSFSHFNPVQTQIFYPTHNTDMSILVGAPTGSGKTVTAELAIFRLFNAHPGAKAVYIAPLKALVSERIKDWTEKFGRRLVAAGGTARRVVELTGDVTPDMAALQGADIIITTPEKWDGISRAWARRSYVQKVGLVIMDEIHLLGEDRGPVLEVIVSRMRYIAARTDSPIRFVGLSTALANPGDLADWLGIPPGGVFNFRPSVRPIPMEVHISGFPGKHYCLAEDMQVLTEGGFMFLDEFLEARARNPHLRVAAYDHSDNTFNYVTPSAVIVNTAAKQQLVELTSGSEAPRWAEDSDPYGPASRASPGALSGKKRSRSGGDEQVEDFASRDGAARFTLNDGLSLRVTPEHDMFVRRGESGGQAHHARWLDKDYSKVKAGALVNVAAVKMLGRAERGYAPSGPDADPPYKSQLGIDTVEQEVAFLELFGYWLCDGTLATVHKGVAGTTRGVRFNTSNEHDVQFIRKACEAIGVGYEQSLPPGGGHCVSIDVGGRPWFDFFYAEYGHGFCATQDTAATGAVPLAAAGAHCAGSFTDAAAAGAGVPPPERTNDIVATTDGSLMPDEELAPSKWIPHWALRRPRDAARAIIAGLLRADGVEADGCGAIYTSSARFRDEVVQLAVHAGYATMFDCEHRADGHRDSDRWGKDAVANHDRWWRVVYRDDPRSADATLDGGRGDIRMVQYEGRTWCVTVPTGLIMVRRAGVDKSGMVTKVSSTQVVGNCPRMASMNKPAFSAIKTYSPDAPVLIFVSSRRQTRLTAMDLIALCAGEENPRRFLRMTDEEATVAGDRAKDQSLKDTLAFGIGIHHAGLPESDRALVEELFCAVKIQVLVCTSTLAWGVNFPAHLVVVKGTEFFDAPSHRYVDYPITDVLQMMGRAGRPQFDTHGVSVILVHEPKKAFYKQFLYEPFPVESQLKGQLVDHINAEIAGGTITSTHDAVEYLTWTYLFRRLVKNPTYYGLDDATTPTVRTWMYELMEGVLSHLHASGCIARGQEAYDMLLAKAAAAAAAAASSGGNSSSGRLIARRPPSPDVDSALCCLTLGYIASVYYVSHATVGLFSHRLYDVESDIVVVPPHPDGGSVVGSVSGAASQYLVRPMLRLLCDASEFASLPVRHNEDGLNEELSGQLPWAVEGESFSSPHVKAYLLLQARLTGSPLPISDYLTDTKTVMDSALRVSSALVDVAGDEGLLAHALGAMRGVQCVVQSRMPDDHPLLQLPHVGVEGGTAILTALAQGKLGGGGGGRGGEDRTECASVLHRLAACTDESLRRVLTSPGAGLSPSEAVVCLRVLRQLPLAVVTWSRTQVEGGRVVGHGGSAGWGGGVGSAGDGSSPSRPSRVRVESDLTLSIAISQARGSTWSRRAYAPGFAKAKEYGWWVVIGSEDGAYSGGDGVVGSGDGGEGGESGGGASPLRGVPDAYGVGGELVALKRASGSPTPLRASTQTLTLSAPSRVGRATLHLHLVSDCVAGVDLELAIHLDVVA